MKKLSENARRHIGETLTIRWGESRGRDTYGYTTCSLRNHQGKRIAACNGGGYDMRGTVIGHWIEQTFSKELLKLKPEDMPKQSHWDYGIKEIKDYGRYFYGLTFHDPSYDPGNAVIGEGCSDRTLGQQGGGKTVADAEKSGESLGLERYQAFYRASSKHPSKKHTVPRINGACGLESVLNILRAIGLDLHKAVSTNKLDVYTIVKATR